MSGPVLEFLIPSDLETPTGGYGYDRRMVAGLTALGWRVRVHRLDDGFPFPSTQALQHAQDVLAGIPSGSLVLIDGLAAGAMPQVLAAHAERLRLVALVHHPLALERGLGAAQASELSASETLALKSAHHIIVTSEATRILLAQRYAVDVADTTVVAPGTQRRPTRHRRRHGSLQLLCVATLIPRKGHDLLIEALAQLRGYDWQLSCVGSLTRSAATVQALRAQLQRLDIAERVALAGEADAASLDRHYGEADLFCLPTWFEGYGMVVAEALAHGLPVIATRTGAIPELIGSEAGVLLAPGDVHGLRDALRRALEEPDWLNHLARVAAATAERLPGWQDSCARMARVLSRQLEL